MDVILASVKRMLGIEEEDVSFDPEILLHINSVFMILNQLGIGPKEGFLVEYGTELWRDFVPDRNDLALIKSYVYAKVRLLFDPPQNSFLVSNIEKLCSEFEWRLNVEAEYELPEVSPVPIATP